jgi:hypothetical protein
MSYTTRNQYGTVRRGNLARPNAFASAPVMFKVMFTVASLFIVGVFIAIILIFTGVIHPNVSYHYEESYGPDGYSRTYDYGSDAR